MDRCPKCNSDDIRKDGVVKQKQRYLCKECRFRFTVSQFGKSFKLKRDAVTLHSDGMSYRSVAHFLNASHVAVYNWTKKFKHKLDNSFIAGEAGVVGIAEIHA